MQRRELQSNEEKSEKSAKLTPHQNRALPNSVLKQPARQQQSRESDRPRSVSFSERDEVIISSPYEYQSRHMPAYHAQSIRKLKPNQSK